MSTPEDRLKETFFIVEATSFEQHSLWSNYAKESDHRLYNHKGLKWEQMDGWMVTVGTLDDRPVCMSLSWVRIEGELVMFWYMCSQVTDSLMAEAWIDKYFTGRWDGGTRSAGTDAQNFHHCIHAIRDNATNKGETKNGI